MRSIITFFNRIKSYFFNTSWIIADKVFSMGLSFLVTIFVARFLGPEKYGILSYAVSMTALFAAAGHMGLSGLVIREFVNQPELIKETFGTTFYLKFIGILAGFVSLILIAIINFRENTIEFWILIITATSILFSPFEVIDYWFQANIKAKYSAIARSISLLFSSLYKLFLVFIGAKLIYFAFSNIIQTFIVASLFIFLLNAKTAYKVKDWKFSKDRAINLLSQSWVLYLGSLFANVYLKFDQLMLRWLVDSSEVGIYAVAARLSEIWYFVPAAIVASFFPKLIKLKDENNENYESRFQQLLDFLFSIALILALIITFISGPIVKFFFGDTYIESASILSLHIWASLFIFMRAAFSKWIIIENAQIYSLITQGSGAIFNIILNYFLIPKYGGYGAAIATLISYAMASYFALVLYKKSRPVFIMMTKAIFSPFRYVIKGLRKIINE